MEETNPPAPVRSPGHHSDSHHLRRYWLVVVERRWLVFCTFAVVVALGALYAFKASPIYESVGRLQIDPESGGMLSVRDGMSWGTKDPDYLQTQYKVLKSRTLLEQVIQKLKLDEDPRYAPADDKVKRVSEDIEVEPERLTRLVVIKARHPDPRRAADMVNTLMDLYLIQNQDRKIKKAYEGLTLLRQEAEQSEKELIKSIEEIHKYRVEKGMISLADAVSENIDAQALRTAQDDYDKQNRATADAQKIADEAEKYFSEGRIADFYGVNQDKLVSDLKSRIQASESRLAELRTRYKDAHEKVVAVLSSLERDKKSLDVEVKRAYETILSSVQVEKAKEVQARRKLEAAERRISELNEARTKYDVLNRKKERNEFFYQQVLAKVREINLNTKDTMANILVDFRAVPQPRYVKPNRPLILAASIVFGLGVSIALAFFINLMDDSIKSQEDVETYLGANFLGYIPSIKVSEQGLRGLHTHLQPTSTASEGFRTLRASVALARGSEKLRVLSVTSTIPEEGKSLFSCNYAIVTAQTGMKTLLVDADLRRPTVQKCFKLQSPHGLSAYLSDSVRNFEEIVHTTEVPNLSVVCCGRVPNNPSELLGSKRMAQFLKEASQHYDRIILDCPPITAVADPLVVASLTDGVIFVTKFNKVRRDSVLKSVQRLQDSGIYLVGVVVNDIDFDGKHSYHGDYYYHQNRYYHSHYSKEGSQEAPGKSGSRKAQETARG
ncbi:MAG: polysaccharide biosynthesis tyrosine autokinase [Verrucomicrobiales bacterium]|nr:polysaccharide biosynthesis tyrosine autokinase [Verrucomicrobiales bacterium]